MLRHISICLLMLHAVGVSACGDDGDDDGVKNAGGQSAAGAQASGRGGEGGANSSGSSGAGSSGSSFPGAPSGPVECGATTCAAQGGGFAGFAMPCCADAAKGSCGMSFMGAACTVPSAGDSRCPTVQAFGGISIPSCCTMEGMCGLDASMFGFGGCTELGAAAMQASSMAMGMGGMIPPPRRCDDASDAGVGDAGS